MALSLMILSLCLTASGSHAAADEGGQLHALAAPANAQAVADAFTMDGVAGFVGGRTSDALRTMLATRVAAWSSAAIEESARARGMMNERGEIDLRRVFAQSPALKEEVRARIKRELKEWLPGATRDLVKERVFQGALGEDTTREIEDMLGRIGGAMDTTFEAEADAYVGGWYDESVARLNALMDTSPATAWLDPTKLRASLDSALSTSTVMRVSAAGMGQLVGDATVNGIRDHMRTMLGGELPPEAMRYLNLPEEKWGELRETINQYMPNALVGDLKNSVLARPLFRLTSSAYGAILAAQAARHFAAAYKGVIVDAGELRRGIEVTRVMVWQLKEKQYLNVSLMDLAGLGKSFAFSIGAETLFAQAEDALGAPLDRLTELADKLDRMIAQPLDRITGELKRTVDEATARLKELEAGLMAPFKEGIENLDGLMAEARDAASGMLPSSFDGIPGSWDDFKTQMGFDGAIGGLGAMTPRQFLLDAGVMDDFERIEGELAALNDRVAGMTADAAAELIADAQLLGPTAVILDAERVPAANPSDSNALDPVLLHNGEFIHRVTDAVLPGRGPDLRFTRIYRSRSAFVGAFGHNWTHAYAERLVPWKREGGGGWTYVRPDGLKFFFLENKDGTFESPKGVALALTKTKEGFVLRDPQGN